MWFIVVKWFKLRQGIKDKSSDESLNRDRKEKKNETKYKKKKLAKAKLSET